MENAKTRYDSIEQMKREEERESRQNCGEKEEENINSKYKSSSERTRRNRKEEMRMSECEFEFDREKLFLSFPTEIRRRRNYSRRPEMKSSFAFFSRSIA